jgi:hypothetical protein
MLDVVKNVKTALGLGTNAAPAAPPVVLSKRDQLQNRIALESEAAENLRKRVGAGIAEPEELDAFEGYLTRLRAQLATLDAQEATARAHEERRATVLPQFERELAELAEDFAAKLQPAAQAAEAVRDKHRQIHREFGTVTFNGFTAVKGIDNPDLLTLCGSGGGASILKALTDGRVSRWLERFESVVLGRKKPAPSDLMLEPEPVEARNAPETVAPKRNARRQP